MNEDDDGDDGPPRGGGGIGVSEPSVSREHHSAGTKRRREIDHSSIIFEQLAISSISVPTEHRLLPDERSPPQKATILSNIWNASALS